MAVQHPSRVYSAGSVQGAPPGKAAAEAHLTDDQTVTDPGPSRQHLLEQLENPDTFESVLMQPATDEQSARIRELHDRFQEEPLTSTEVFGDASHPPNPNLQANFYDQIARQLEHLAHTTQNTETRRVSQRYALQRQQKAQQLRLPPQPVSEEAPGNPPSAIVPTSLFRRLCSWLLSWIWG